MSIPARWDDCLVFRISQTWSLTLPFKKMIVSVLPEHFNKYVCLSVSYKHQCRLTQIEMMSVI